MPPSVTGRIYAPIVLLLSLSLMLAGCAARGTIAFVETAATGGTQQHLFVASHRTRAGLPGDYGSGRSYEGAYSQYAISVPANHRAGNIEWPGNAKPDVVRHFVTTDVRNYKNISALQTAINREMVGKRDDQREALVFVHGYNTNFSEGLYRLAQLQNDFEIPGLTILFSWPSAGDARGYIYDRDSADYARDGLESLLNGLVNTDVAHIVLVAHSLGSFLAMETLRQMENGGPTRLRAKLAGVVLVSPDIDIELFKAQARHIAPLPQPFLMVVSKRDQALRLSARLTGKRSRLGSISADDAEELEEFNVTILDISEFADGDRLGHFTAATSPVLISFLKNLPDKGENLFTDPVREANAINAGLNVVKNATAIILRP